jgi:hypothetical protein
MRALGVWLCMIAATAALADAPAVIDLDNDEDGARRLAEAAGACAKRQPAFIKTWCNTTKPRKARFTKRFEAKASDAGVGKLAVELPVTEYGKGFVSAVAQPKVTCTPDACLPSSTVTVVIRPKLKVAAADVHAVTVTFDVGDMWRDKQWWGPKATNITVTLWNAAGTSLGDGTVARIQSRLPGSRSSHQLH